MAEIDSGTSAVIMQNPNFFGIVEDYSDIFAAAKAAGALSILVFYPLSLGILKTPAEMGADIAVGEGQSLGQPLSFGGPYLGMMAVTKALVRKMPGRIAGESVDRNGKKAYVLTLQAREQHIRREKAVSNICSNQALCALRAVIYVSLLGKTGLKETALINAQKTEYLKKKMEGIGGVEVMDGPVFNEFTVKLPYDAKILINKMMSKGYMAGIPAYTFYKDKKEYMITAVTEKRTENEIEGFAAVLRQVI